MMKDVTIGQYYPSGSLLHKLDPRVKLFGTMIFIITVFSYRGIVGFAFVTIFLAGIIKLSRVPFSFMFRGVRALAVLMAVTAFFQIFFTASPNIIWEWKFLHITQEGIASAIKMTLRLTYLVIGSSIMTLTTTPKELTDGLEKSFQPLEKLHVPVNDAAMMMSIALRFIPILSEETNKIMQAQMARGADFENGNLIKKAKAMMPLLVPLFVSAFRRANDLATAMESRCFCSGERRTKMKPLKYEKRDYIGYLVLLVFLTAVLVLRTDELFVGIL